MKELYSWWCANLTTEQGIREFYGGLTAIDEGNFRIESSVLSIYLDNTTTTNIRQLDNRRLFRADGVYPVLDPTSGGGGIDVVWRNTILISSDISVPTVDQIADAVWDETYSAILPAAASGSFLNKLTLRQTVPEARG